MLEELKEKYANKGSIAIRPYVDSEKSNMGLENHKYVVFPGVHQMEEMACITYRGKVRYLNGLDEFAPEVKMLKEENPEAYKAKVMEIRTIVAELELEKTFNKIDPKDPDFWAKVETFRPDNKEIWGKISVRCDNKPMPLSPQTNTDHLLLILAIEVGGFPLIAKSYEDVRSGNNTKKWYLDKQIETVGKNVSVTKTKNKALSMLEEMADENPRKLFYLSKIVDTNSIQYKNGTLQTVIYENMDTYISGQGSEPKVKLAAERFLKFARMDTGELKIKAIIKDATFFNIIATKGDGMLHYPKGNVMLGKNVEEVYEKLNNPVNEDLLDVIFSAVEATW